MAYRVSPNGTIECDTAQEAIELQALISARAPQREKSSAKRRAEVRQAANQPDYAEYWNQLNKIGRAILGVLSEQSAAISGEILVRKCGITTKDLPSKMIHVRRTAKRLSVPEPVVRVTEIVDRRPVGMYRIAKQVEENLTDQLGKWKEAQKKAQ